MLCSQRAKMETVRSLRICGAAPCQRCNTEKWRPRGPTCDARRGAASRDGAAELESQSDPQKYPNPGDASYAILGVFLDC